MLSAQRGNNQSGNTKGQQPRSDNQGTSESIPTRRPNGSVNLPMPHAHRLLLDGFSSTTAAPRLSIRAVHGDDDQGSTSGGTPVTNQHQKEAKLLSYTARITPVAANEHPVHTLSCSTKTHFFIGFPMSINNTSTITHGRNVQRRRCEKTNALKIVPHDMSR